MKTRKRLGSALTFFLLALILLFLLFPLYWMLLTSFKTNMEAYKFPPSFVPLAPTADPDFWDNMPPPKTRPTRPAAAKEAPAEPVSAPEDPPKLTVDLRKDPEAFTDDEAALLRALQGDKILSADELTEKTGIPARRVLSAMTLLQVRQLAGQIPGRGFRSHVTLIE